ncbi:MAG: hypothetical protein QM775_09225 [Pirellulales bacterium]
MPQAKAAAFEKALAGVPHALVGEVTDSGRLEVLGIPHVYKEPADEPTELRVPRVIDAKIEDLKAAWQKPLKW